MNTTIKHNDVEISIEIEDGKVVVSSNSHLTLVMEGRGVPGILDNDIRYNTKELVKKTVDEAVAAAYPSGNPVAANLQEKDRGWPYYSERKNGTGYKWVGKEQKMYVKFENGEIHQCENLTPKDMRRNIELKEDEVNAINLNT